ncbi:LysM peptidoglycan-binding domain-containing protein [Thalassobacillus pellis]|uniref:LysM peptidoglycan-binding domain-containing protein n=1 Tax=Thalassobacillus pellis TaxID=748008 RepID=UPI0019604C99|nr:LysM peptidoglycan-binding domain-containing protein [Thalassobacillus pellis]MBM7552225.1 spore germination protein [Thalassobacillus pellis]
MLIHVVESGDTLWGLAQHFGLTAGAIADANELESPDRLLIGQALIIPVTARQHIVGPGDTLWRIAQYYRVPLPAIIQANQIADPDVLTAGQSLIIPARSHTIQPGETLWEIARRYGTTVAEIVKLNGIQDPALIYPGTAISLPFPKPAIEVNAYTINIGETGAEDIREVGDLLTYASPFAYIMREDGNLNPINDQAIIAAAYEERVAPMMCITNFTYLDPGSDLARTILSSVDIQNELLSNIITTMENKGYLGLNIDFENVYPADREKYNQFLQRAVDRLHPYGYFVSTALAPKTSAAQKGLLYEAHDYEAHGRIVDFVILMTYEWGYRLGPPRAISPLNEIRRVLDYAVSVIPRNKIFMGFQLYARDWVIPHVEGQEAETFDMQKAVRRAISYGAAIQYDTVAESPFYRYVDEQGIRHEVWFEDARSAQAKFDTVKEYGLRGVSYWVLGYPFPQNWVLLEENFRIKKII